MRNYSISPYVKHNWQIISDFCLQLDQKILSVQNYIDFSNPNKIILNYIYNETEMVFYTNTDLLSTNLARREYYTVYEDDDDVQADIDNLVVGDKFEFPDQTQAYQVTKIEDDTVFYKPTEFQIIGINLNQLYPGQIIYNNFGEFVYLYSTEDSITPIQTIPQGMAIFKILDEQKDYQVIALDSTGDFYIFSNYDTANKIVIFQLLPHATSTYGMNYLFSFTAENVRWFYNGDDAHITGYSLYAPSDWNENIIYSWTWPNDSRIPIIISKCGTLWSDNSVLSCEIMRVKNNTYEEVSCELHTKTGSYGIDKGSQSRYTINTDMRNEIAQFMNIRILLY